MKVKICGITNWDDAKLASECGADALGFIFFKDSPRYIRPDAARRIVAMLPPFLLTVGVFVDEELPTVRHIVDSCGLSLAQLHGNEDASFCDALERPVLKAVRLRDRASLLGLAEYKGQTNVRGFVIDSYVESSYGGTGKQADWSLAAEAARTWPILLAGGLTPENVQAAVREVRPYGVDVSSGVEASPGKKDPGKLKEFIRAAKLVT